MPSRASSTRWRTRLRLLRRAPHEHNSVVAPLGDEPRKRDQPLPKRVMTQIGKVEGDERSLRAAALAQEEGVEVALPPLRKTTASPTISASSAGGARIASVILARRSVKSAPRRVHSWTRSPCFAGKKAQPSRLTRPSLIFCQLGSAMIDHPSAPDAPAGTRVSRNPKQRQGLLSRMSE
jgi:hypothetical protein